MLPGQVLNVGRSIDADLPVPWDPHISRLHARLTVSEETVQVQQLPQAGNPIFYRGKESASFKLLQGERFVAGSTAFTLENRGEQQQPRSDLPFEEVQFEPGQLRDIRYRDADQRINVLNHLPEVIRQSQRDSDLYQRLINLILAGVSHAEAVAIVRSDADESSSVLRWDRRRETAGPFRPSSSLVSDALVEHCRSILHVWNTQDQGRENEGYTAVAGLDWAFCTPVRSSGGAAWGLYVAGRLSEPVTAIGGIASVREQLQPDVKFTELVAEIIASVQRVKTLEGRQSRYRQFFPPAILSALGDDFDADLLEPRECDATVMFCDLRGFSQQAEESADDLIGLLERVSLALDVMRTEIHRFGGVTGDFQGDAALGFWGWPFPSREAPGNACRAALAIRQHFDDFRRDPDHPLFNFQMGIGIAHGRAVAGKIGTRDQLKFTVFGPVVNLASRLEGMTKQLRVPVVLDHATAELVEPQLKREEGRLRTLAQILPYGMENSVRVSELLPPVSQRPDLTDELIDSYNAGVEQFIQGDWEAAWTSLHAMPASDRAQDFLSMLITQHNRIAPPDWDGIVRLGSK
ncbi:MAG: adenylate/guanylate cyclase domain-containing protein [Planctomycetaceae bacterium]|nr:adenylate/guanylate cyclase domain-containing protein [Planctomycetaceae bacterium]